MSLKKSPVESGRQRVYKFTKIEDLLAHTNLKQTLKKGLKDQLSPTRLEKKEDYQKRLDNYYERRIKNERTKRRRLMHDIAEMQKDVRPRVETRDSIRNMQDYTVVNECSRRRDRRATLFKKELIGKGKGGGKEKNYRTESKIKC